MNSIIKTVGLSKKFMQGDETVVAIDDINISIAKGEFTAIVGPSGSGKTTLLQQIGALDKPSSGSVYVDQVDVSKLNEDKRTELRRDKLGFVFQNYNLIPVLTALENTAFILELQNVDEVKKRLLASDALTKVGLADKFDFLPSHLSGGQQQRVAIARALAPNPDIILADEPTANLDTSNTESLLDIMQKLNEEEGRTFVFSTHDPRVMKRSKRIIKLEDGKIIDESFNR